MEVGNIFPWIFGVVFSIQFLIPFVVIVIFFFSIFRYIKHKHLIEGLPTSKVRSIAMGLVEIQGIATPALNKILKSSLTNKDCVYYRIEIEDRSRRKHPKIIFTEEEAEHFYLKDETGMVLINPKDAKFELNEKFESYEDENTPKIVKDFLKNNNLHYKNCIRCREYYIAPKDNLYIIGTAMDNPFVKTSSVGVRNVMIALGDNEKIFYISDKEEREMISGLNFRIKLPITVLAMFISWWFGGYFQSTLIRVIGSLAAIIFLFAKKPEKAKNA